MHKLFLLSLLQIIFQNRDNQLSLDLSSKHIPGKRSQSSDTTLTGAGRHSWERALERVTAGMENGRFSSVSNPLGLIFNRLLQKAVCIPSEMTDTLMSCYFPSCGTGEGNEDSKHCAVGRSWGRSQPRARGPQKDTGLVIFVSLKSIRKLWKNVKFRSFQVMRSCTFTISKYFY